MDESALARERVLLVFLQLNMQPILLMRDETIVTIATALPSSAGSPR